MCSSAAVTSRPRDPTLQERACSRRITACCWRSSCWYWRIWARSSCFSARMSRCGRPRPERRPSCWAWWAAWCAWISAITCAPGRPSPASWRPPPACGPGRPPRPPPAAGPWCEAERTTASNELSPLDATRAGASQLLDDGVAGHRARRARRRRSGASPGTGSRQSPMTIAAAICGSGSSGSTPARAASATAATCVSRSVIPWSAAESAGVSSTSEAKRRRVARAYGRPARFDPLVVHPRDLAHEHVDDGVRDRPPVPLIAQRLGDLAGLVVLAVEEQRLLGREVVVDGLLRHVARRRDLADPHLLEPALEEHPGGDVGDPLAELALLAVAQALAGDRRRRCADRSATPAPRDGSVGLVGHVVQDTPSDFQLQYSSVTVRF